MNLSKLEKDFIGDLAQDSHELWELYGFIRYHNPNLNENEVLKCGRNIIKDWMGRGWLKASKSRSDSYILSMDELINAIDKLGLQASDPKKGIILIELTNRASKDIEWLPK